LHNYHVPGKQFSRITLPLAAINEKEPSESTVPGFESAYTTPTILITIVFEVVRDQLEGHVLPSFRQTPEYRILERMLSLERIKMGNTPIPVGLPDIEHRLEISALDSL